MKIMQLKQLPKCRHPRRFNFICLWHWCRVAINHLQETFYDLIDHQITIFETSFENWGKRLSIFDLDSDSNNLIQKIGKNW